MELAQDGLERTINNSLIIHGLCLFLCARLSYNEAKIGWHPLSLSGGHLAIFRHRNLVHSTISCLTGWDIDDSFLALIVMHFVIAKQLCLAVSLISTAANSAWDGEFRVKCRQGCAGTVMGWREGTDQKRERLTRCALFMILVNHVRLTARYYVFYPG